MSHKIRSVLFCLSWLALPYFVFSSVGIAKERDEEGGAKASIHLQGKVKKSELPALAKISLEDALKAARAAAPGSVLKVELEVEHGGLMYSFHMVNADKKIVEVEIDAGDGKVLDVDSD